MGVTTNRLLVTRLPWDTDIARRRPF